MSSLTTTFAKEHPPRAKLTAVRTVLACLILLAGYAAIAGATIHYHAATFDEPLHAVGSYFHVFDHDYRINPEDPPLWNYLVMAPHYRGELHNRTNPQAYLLAAQDLMADLPIVTQLLYRTPPNDAVEFINASRYAMLIAAVGLGAVLACWSYRLAGGAAAIFACALFCLDPNFLAHGPLLKNDVCLSLVLLGATWTLASVGRRVTAWNLPLLLLIVAAGPIVKFSGVLVIFIALVLLLIRALLPIDWAILGRIMRTRATRLVAVCGIAASIALVCDGAIWAVYGFRFDPTPTPGMLLPADRPIRLLKANQFILSHGRDATDAELAAMPTPLTARVEQFAERHHLLPQAWLFGMLYTYQSTLVRPAYLFGQRYDTGHWYYFPCAMLFKTPLATLAVVIVALITLAPPRWRKRSTDAWSQTCILVALGSYSISALTTHLNLGLRHVLPIYPLIFLLLALRFRSMIAIVPRASATMVGLLVAALAVETIAVYPHYLSFFNLAARPSRLQLLSDSNFEWGQDLPFVVDWRQRHPGETLYLGYWSTAEPHSYPIGEKDLPTEDVPSDGSSWPKPDERCVVAVAATLLQGMYCDPGCEARYAEIRRHQPREIIGDTIYVYDWPLK